MSKTTELIRDALRCRKSAIGPTSRCKVSQISTRPMCELRLVKSENFSGYDGLDLYVSAFGYFACYRVNGLRCNWYRVTFFDENGWDLS